MKRFFLFAMASGCVSASLVAPESDPICVAEQFESGFVIVIGPAPHSMMLLDASYDAPSDRFIVSALCASDRTTTLGVIGTMKLEATETSFSLVSDGTWAIPTRAAYTGDPFSGAPMKIALQLAGPSCTESIICSEADLLIQEPVQVMAHLSPLAVLYKKPLPNELFLAQGQPGACELVPIDIPIEPCPTCTWWECHTNESSEPSCTQCLQDVCDANATCCGENAFDFCVDEIEAACRCWYADPDLNR